MTTATQTLFNVKASYAFNVFYTEDTTTLGFLPTLVSKNPWEWTMLRNLFEGKRASIMLVDRSIETPFHCLLAALFCKQLVEELGCKLDKLHTILTPLKKEKPGSLVSVNDNFDTTQSRDNFLRECFFHTIGKRVAVNSKHNPIHCRDLKISIEDYTLYIRCEGGIGHGWYPSDKYLAGLPASELLSHYDNDLACRNVYVHKHSRTGVFINIELQSKIFDKKSVKQQT